jgi:branched-chain amino acid transport system substrate-binding protein
MHQAGSDEVITPETRYTFRVGLLPAGTTAQAQAQLVEEEGYENVAAIIGDYAWGQSMLTGIQENFPVEVNTQVAPVGASDFSSFIRRFPQDVEMVIATGHPPGTLTFVRQLFELGYEPEIITGSGFPPSVVRDALGESITRGFAHLHMADVFSDEFISVAERYGQEVGQQFTTITAIGYVTGQMIAQAIENAGEATPEAIRDATREIEFDTLYAEPIQYTEFGELENQSQLYSFMSTEAPSYFSDGNFSFSEAFRTDPLPGIPPEA